MTAPNIKHDLSIMRISATIAVIFLHTCSTLAENPDIFHMARTEHTVLFTGVFFMNWSVPLFLMISGCLLLNENKEITPKDCVTKYSKRALLALIVFGVPFSCMKLYMDSRQFSIQLLPQGIWNVVYIKYGSHLWYLYALIGIYLTLPIWKAYIRSSDRNTQRYILTCLFIFNFCITVINTAFDIKIAFDLPLSSFTIFYFLAGKYIHDEVPYLLQKKRQNIILLAVLYSFLIIVSALIYPDASSYLSYNSPLIALISIVLFATLSGCRIKPTIKDETLWKIDRLCFAVYLIHPLFIQFFYKFLQITPLSFGSLYFIMVFVFCTGFIILSFISSWIMNKIPLLKSIL